MQCVDALDAYMDALLRGVEAEERVQQHVRTCGACAAEVRTLDEQWQALGALAAHDRVADVPVRVVAHATPRASWLRIAAVLSGLLAAGAAGYAAGAAGAAPAAAQEGQEYMLLLYETAESDASNAQLTHEQVVERFRTWAGDLAVREQLVAGEELQSEGARWLHGTSETAPLQHTVATGFFLVRAADDGEALALARTSPHAQAGGITELRQIRKGNGR